MVSEESGGSGPLCHDFRESRVGSGTSGGFRRLERQGLDFAIPGAEAAVAQWRFVTCTVEPALKPGRCRAGVATVDRRGGTCGTATAPLAVFEGVKNR